MKLLKCIPMPMRPYPLGAIWYLDSEGNPPPDFDEWYNEQRIQMWKDFIPKLRECHQRLKEQGKADSEVNDAYANEERYIRKKINEWEEERT